MKCIPGIRTEENWFTQGGLFATKRMPIGMMYSKKNQVFHGFWLIHRFRAILVVTKRVFAFWHSRKMCFFEGHENRTLKLKQIILFTSFFVVVMVEGHSLIKWFEQIAVFWLLRIITPLKKMDKNNQLLSFIFPWVGFASFCEMQFKELFNGVTTCPFILSHTLPIFSAWQPVREVILNSFIGFGGTQRTIEMKMEFSRGCLHRRPRRAVTTVPTLNHWTDEEKRRYISPIN